ncbi:MAG: hydroxysqualene dehydroxylase HpnE [Pseudomonadota bacterium]
MCAAEVGKTVAVIGAGWAGCSAAIELSNAGCQVTLLEAARTLGGRARGVHLHGTQLDNGQHILLGAYKESLRMLELVGIDAASALLNLPLQMRYPFNSGGMDFVAPRLPAPLHLVGALLRARGLSAADRMALARFSSTARWMGWRLKQDCSVSELLDRYDQSAKITALMWRPLCLAALNTPPECASANVFLAVLRDSLGAERRASDMLLPRTDLSSLFPAAAARLLERRGNSVRSGAKVSSLKLHKGGKWQVDVSGTAVGGTWMAYFDAVIVATPPAAAAVLLHDLPAMRELVAQLTGFAYEPITTCYLKYPAGTRLALPFYALLDDPTIGNWGQFVFDRGQLDTSQDGVLSVVVSASDAAATLPQAVLAEALAKQLARVFQRPELGKPEWVQVITEKRATFACTPGLQRPRNGTGVPGLSLAGDYTHGEYPATLEGAVRSGVLAAQSLF